MSRQSQTEIAVLGALSVEPMSGYAVRAAITETLGHFWSESFGQIYPTLSRLETDGHVVRDAEGQTSGSTFRLTRSGRSRLVALLHEPIAAAPPRNGTLLRLFFGGLLGPDTCAEVVTAARDRALALLDEMAGARADIEAEGRPDAAYWLMTVSAGEHAARAQVAWADETLETLRHLPTRRLRSGS
jgi:DNA-binding PadR family transcriptional regulator